jgi:S1-C subfamily serine protease
MFNTSITSLILSWLKVVLPKVASYQKLLLARKSLAVLNSIMLLVIFNPNSFAQTSDPLGNPLASLQPEERRTIALFQKTSSSVVYITSLELKRDLFSLNAVEIPQGAGSGVIWNRDGYILTNYHVIKDAEAAQVTLSDRSVHRATLIGYEVDKDLAVLKINPVKTRLNPITLGDSNILLVGQSVIAIGNPFGFDHTLTTGIISGLGREIQAENGRLIKGVIQTDAAINPGNSGGPLLNSLGEMIGVNTAIYSPSGAYAGIGFAVPISVVNRIVPQLIKYGKIAKPGIGVTFLDDYIARSFGIKGAIIEDVLAEGPASIVGLKPTQVDLYGRLILGDIIIEVDKKRIASLNNLRDILEEKKIGTEVEMIVVRGDTAKKVRLKIIKER